MSTEKPLSPIDKAVAKIADLIIQRMEQLKGDNWEKGWLNANSSVGLPQNIAGRQYQGSNIAILSLVSAIKGHEMPVFTTFNEAKKEGLHINKGATSIPVIYYSTQYKDTDGTSLTEQEYRNLPQVEQLKVQTFGILKKFDVFNIADTNFKEVKPELYEAFRAKYTPVPVNDTQGMYTNRELDRMFATKEWLCPIDIRPSNTAYFHPVQDYIVLPEKMQFKISQDAEGIYRNGMSFYATALHEMAHSTGTSDRLARTQTTTFGSKDYAKEELVAELTAAIVGQQLGFDKKIKDGNAKYLNGWVENLKQEPRFILQVLSDVSKATTMIMEQVEAQKQKLEVYTSNNIEKAVVTDVTLTKQKSGEYAVRGKVDGVDTGLIPITHKDAVAYHSISNIALKENYLQGLVAEVFKNQPQSPQLSASHKR